jgi:hypothetical protein
MKRCLFFAAFFLTFSLNIVKAQAPELKEAFVEADSYFLFEEYNEALPLFNRIHRADPTNNNINYKIGICLLNDPFQKDKSIRYLEEASEDINPKYKENNFKETQAPPEIFFYLGHAYLVNNELDKAIENYNHFLTILDEEVYNIDLVEEQIRICERAKYLKSKPVDFDNENLGELLNDRFSATNSIISGNGKYLVFVSELAFYDAPFFSEKVDGKWQGPRNIITDLGVDEDVYPTCLSWDGKTMLLYKNDAAVGNLYMSKYVDERWSKIVKLGPNINTKYWESHGTLSQDGKTLYFTSNRKGGYGGLDIYKSVMEEDGTWGVPENLGEKINSLYNEDTPFLTENQQILYFSSQGHYNMGGYDIFYSVRDAGGEWDTPLNMGYPINSTDNDLFYFPINNGLNAYYSQYHDEGYGRHDLYYLTLFSENNPRMYLITGVVSGENDRISEDDEVVIYLIDRLSGDTTNIAKPNPETNTFEIKAPKGDYDLLMHSMKFNELVQRIRIDEKTDKKNGIALANDKLILEIKEYVPKAFTVDDSKIEIQNSTVEARAGEEMSVALKVEKGSMMIVTQYVDSMIVSIDTIYVESDSLNYDINPLEGSNHIVFAMIEENGDSSTSEMTFYVIPAEPSYPHQTILSNDEANIAASKEELKAINKSDNDPSKLHQIMLENCDDELKYYLEKLDLDKEGIYTTEDLLTHLGEHAGDEYAAELLIPVLSQSVNENPVSDYLDYIVDNSAKPIRKLLKKIDLEKEGLTSISELISYLQNNNEELGLTKEELDQLFVELLTDYAKETLTDSDQEDEGEGVSKGLKIAGSLLFTGVLFFIIFFLRKRKVEEDQ